MYSKLGNLKGGVGELGHPMYKNIPSEAISELRYSCSQALCAQHSTVLSFVERPGTSLTWEKRLREIIDMFSPVDQSVLRRNLERIPATCRALVYSVAFKVETATQPFGFVFLGNHRWVAFGTRSCSCETVPCD